MFLSVLYCIAYLGVMGLVPAIGNKWQYWEMHGGESHWMVKKTGSEGFAGSEAPNKRVGRQQAV